MENHWKSLNNPWTTLEQPLKTLRNIIDTSMKHQWQIIEHLWNILENMETSGKFMDNALKTSLTNRWKSWNIVENHAKSLHNRWKNQKIPEQSWTNHRKHRENSLTIFEHIEKIFGNHENYGKSLKHHRKSLFNLLRRFIVSWLLCSNYWGGL